MTKSLGSDWVDMTHEVMAKMNMNLMRIMMEPRGWRGCSRQTYWTKGSDEDEEEKRPYIYTSKSRRLHSTGRDQRMCIRFNYYLLTSVAYKQNCIYSAQEQEKKNLVVVVGGGVMNMLEVYKDFPGIGINKLAGVERKTRPKRNGSSIRVLKLLLLVYFIQLVLL